MPFATTHCVSLHGALGHVVDVQADVSSGAVGTTLVGRADAALSEGQDRCRMAVINSDLPWPGTHRITVLLSPAGLVKRGTHFDLAIAVAILAAAGHVPRTALAGTLLLGELTLSGGLRPVAGALPMVLAAADRGVRRVVLPEPQAGEAAMVPGMEVVGLRSLGQVVAELRGENVPTAPPVASSAGSQLLAWRGEERLEEVDLADLRGMADAKHAVEVAAAGGHAVLLTGPKGSGKTSIAERVPSILPDLTPEESLELTAVHSLAGTLDAAQGMIRRPGFSAPHHDASKASIVGGGSGQVRPGEISRAHAGVLLLDEFPLFRTDVIEALRQPLESGEITVARQEESVTLPARGLLLLACNPCPCGDWHEQAGRNRCSCRERSRREYRAKISGPIADRIDISSDVAPLRAGDHDVLAVAETSAEVRRRVAAARERQARRYVGCGWRLNGHVPGPALRDRWPVAEEGRRRVERATYDGTLSSRGAVRVLRLAWTLADLAAVRRGHPPGEEMVPDLDAVEAALQLRTGRALPVALLRPPLPAAPVEAAR